MKKLLFGVAAVALLAVSAVTAYEMSEPAAKTTASVGTPTVFRVAGTITVRASNASDDSDGGDCYATDGYDDIRSGAQVTVKDETGTVIALGSVDPGHVLESSSYGAMTCIFGFHAGDVPENKAFYTIEVSHRGELRYTRGDLAQALTLTLGDDK